MRLKSSNLSLLVVSLISCVTSASADEFNSRGNAPQNPDPYRAQTNAPTNQPGMNSQMQAPTGRGYYKARTAPMPNAYRNPGIAAPHSVAPPPARESAPETVTIDQSRTQDLSLPDDSNQSGQNQSSQSHRSGGWGNVLRRGVNRIPIH